MSEILDEMRDQVRSGQGFIAALDQSGGSTPKALRLYGVDESEYSNDDEMFDRIHEMRSRIVTSPSFAGDRVLGAILFENTMDREIERRGSAAYLWDVKHVVPFLKVDQGLADEHDGVQLMNAMPELDALCERAVGKGVFGTKMRSVVKQADAVGIEAVVAQQFEVGGRILEHGLVPILEPEVDIHCPDKELAEELLREAITNHLAGVPADQPVMLKLTIATVDDFYRPLVEHDRVLRVVALSGGYSREQSNHLLARNHGVIASFSRALTEGLTAQMPDSEFDAALDASIASIYAASIT
jgi:fructose-bisphosphate aldolase class I